MVDGSIVMLAETTSITIPIAQYDVLVKKAFLLDMAIVAKPAQYGYEKEQVLNLIGNMIADGWLEC